jgi:hypothetical protein
MLEGRMFNFITRVGSKQVIKKIDMPENNLYVGISKLDGPIVSPYQLPSAKARETAKIPLKTLEEFKKSGQYGMLKPEYFPCTGYYGEAL